jgi:hypothetical protein
MLASSSMSPSSSPASQASKMATWAPTKARAITGTGTRACFPAGGEPVTEVLLGVTAQGGQVGLAGPGVAEAGLVQAGHLGRLFVRGGDGVPVDHVRRPALAGDALHQVLGEPVEDRELHGFFGGVVGVEGGPGQVGSVGDVFHGDPVIPVLEDQGHERVLDRRLGAGDAPLGAGAWSGPISRARERRDVPSIGSVSWTSGLC